MTFSKALKRVSKELSKDKTERGLYYVWQSTLAFTVMNTCEVSDEKANESAKKFLDLLIKG